ncbi:glycine zipper family protein [Helicobacter pylori]|uniref:glycine zipper family protein n=1 Tax=Helicobacter pylori TaxID=210 RepID=UPI001E574920|nr:glycine zipper family protein [Helicobacter pylori]
MPLPFILGGLVLAAAGYGVKKGLDAKSSNDEAKDLFKKAEERLEETKKRVESAESSYKNALMRLGEKKLHVISRGVSRFVEHFNQLKGHEFVISNMNMQNIQEQVSEALNVVNKCKEMGLSDLASLGGVIAILGVLSTKKMEKKLEDVKAYCCEVEKAITEAYGVIDDLLAVERVVKLFTRQIAKFDALLFSLSQDSIATMKKHNYNHSLYSQEERDQLCVAVSTLMTLSAFLKVPIIDKDQKLQEKAKRALEIMKGQMDSLESGHYDVAMIQSRQQDLENL